MSRLLLHLLLVALHGLLRPTGAYPVIIQVDESSNRCFSFSIPQDDDAHVVIVPLPGESEIPDEKAELWYVDQVYKMTKIKTKKLVIPKQFPDASPDHVAKFMSGYLQESGDNRANLHIRLTETNPTGGQKAEFAYPTKYFLPTVINHVRKLIRGRGDSEEEQELEGYRVCFENSDEEKQIQVIFDMILDSEEVEDDDPTGGFQKEKHLTPLEESLDHSIAAANSVLREMKYLEKREARMRETADNINARVRWFSYLSVSVLLAVTYIQVTYLKRYFHKKKLM